MKFSKLFKGDKVIWVVFFLLSIISLVAVYSSIGLEAYTHRGHTPTGLFLKHLGIVAATKQYSRTDYTISVIALAGISLPTFFWCFSFQAW